MTPAEKLESGMTRKRVMPNHNAFGGPDNAAHEGLDHEVGEPPDMDQPSRDAYADVRALVVEHRPRRGEETRAAARLIIRLKAGQLHEYAAATEQLVAREMYVRGGRVVRIGLSSEINGLVGPAIARDRLQAVVLPA